jgi:hypothetical protein
MEDQAKEILNYLKKVHISNSKLVDFSVNDKKKAIWYLQGSSISTAYSVLDHFVNGHAISAAKEWRFANEIRDLIALMDGMEEDDRRIKAWYKGHVVERKKGELLPRLKNSPLPEAFYADEEKIKREHIDELSKLVHPTLNAVRYNAYRLPSGSEAFSYDWDLLKKFSDINLIIKSALICAVHSLSYPLRTFNLTQPVRDNLNELYETASKM